MGFVDKYNDLDSPELAKRCFGGLENHQFGGECTGGIKDKKKFWKIMLDLGFASSQYHQLKEIMEKVESFITTKSVDSNAVDFLQSRPGGMI